MRRVSANPPLEWRPFTATDADCFVNPGLRPGLWNSTPSGSERRETPCGSIRRFGKRDSSWLSPCEYNSRPVPAPEATSGKPSSFTSSLVYCLYDLPSEDDQQLGSENARRVRRQSVHSQHADHGLGPGKFSAARCGGRADAGEHRGPHARRPPGRLGLLARASRRDRG
jgi:hypothetical protein